MTRKFVQRASPAVENVAINHEHEWCRCIGRKGALMRSGKPLTSDKVCEVGPDELVRKVGTGAAHKKDGSTERRLKVLIPELSPGGGSWEGKEGWVSAKLFVPCTEDESERMDRLTGAAFRAPAAEVAKAVLDEARSTSRAAWPSRQHPMLGALSGGRPEGLPLSMSALPRPDLNALRTLPYLVSVLVPTTPSRRWAHRSLYESFRQQAWPNKELIVLETGDDPSRFAGARKTFSQETTDLSSMSRGGGGGGGGSWALRDASSGGTGVEASTFWSELEDDRVTYVYERRDSELGPKRNALAKMARGQILAQFDDDDLYQPHYLDAMVHALLLDAVVTEAYFDPTIADEPDDALIADRVKEPRLVKFASFVCYNARQSTLQVCDTTPPSSRERRGPDLFSADEYHSRFWGYGFSYVYTAAFLKLQPFAHITFGEDYVLVCEAAARGAACAAYADDQRNPAVLHVLHDESSTMTLTSNIVALPGDCRRRYGPQLKLLFGEEAPQSVPHATDPFGFRRF